MLSSISFSPPDGSLPFAVPPAPPPAERRKRITEAVYALCVVAAGILLIMTAV